MQLRRHWLPALLLLLLVGLVVTQAASHEDRTPATVSQAELATSTATQDGATATVTATKRATRTATITRTATRQPRATSTPDLEATTTATPVPPPTEQPVPPTEIPTELSTEIPTESPTETSTDPAELPADLPLLHAEVAAPTPVPTSIGEEAHPSEPVRITIASIGLDQPVIPVGLDAQNVPIVPQHDVGWYQFSAMPGQGENVVLWGHVARFQATPNIPAPFEQLHTAAIGDTITLYAADGTSHSYVITEQIWALPHEVAYILPQGSERLTLVSCIGDRIIANGALVDMSNRLITIGVRVNG